VRKFLEDAGLHVTGVSANRLLINATGTVAQVEQAFAITISQYHLDGRTVFAPDRSPLIPVALAPSIQGIVGLDNVGQVHPAGEQALLQPAQRSAVPPGFTPTDLRSAYDVASLISAGGDGTGQNVAVVEFAPYIPGDLAAFRSHYSLPSATVNNHSVDLATVTCATAGTSCDVSGISEADLDVEVVSALAPNATQDVYTGPNTGAGELDTYQAIVTDDADTVITTSWGLCEPAKGSADLQALDNIFIQAAAQGQTVFAAAGDTGSDGCNSGGALPQAVLSPASDPYVAGVGGTTLTLSGGLYSSEITWNDLPTHSNPIGTGGGNSSYFGRYSWQVGLNMPNNSLRLVPDVAANADPYTGYSVYCTSAVLINKGGCSGTGTSWVDFGGTSAATPLWAGILADVNGYLLANSLAATGWVNSALYQLLGSSQTYTPFHDVTSGNNNVDYSSGGFNAGACYDEVTGVGTPDAWNIARDIQGGIKTAGGGSCPIPPAGTQLIQDGGFETVPGPWQTFSQGGYDGMVSFNPHTGANTFLGCAYPSCDDRAAQTFTVPGTVHSAQLSFWEDGFNALGAGPLCLDHFYVTLSTPDGTVFDPVTGSCIVDSNGYTHALFDVTTALQAHTAQQVTLTLRVTAANLSNYTIYDSAVFVDDVSLVVL
jgi:kumamolisin